MCVWLQENLLHKGYCLHVPINSFTLSSTQLNGAKREVKDVFYLLALQGLNYIAPLIVLPYLIVVLGAEKFGYIGFSLSVTQYLMLIVDFGFNLSATKRIALEKNNPEQLNKIFTATLYAKFGLLLLSFIILVALSFISQFAIYRETMFIMFLMVIANTFSFVWLFQGLSKIRIVSVVNMVAKLSILPLTFLLVKTDSDYLWAAFIQSFVYVFAAILTVIIVFKDAMVAFVTVKIKDIMQEIKESSPVFLSGAATSIYTTTFVIVLGYFATPQEVGQYAAVEKIMRALCYLGLAPIAQAFYPKISQLAVENFALAKLYVQRILFIMFGFMALVFVGMFFLSPVAIDIVVNVFGKTDYLGTEILFKVMAILPLIIGVGGVVAQLGILAMGNSKDKKTYKNIYFLAGVVALSCIFIFIPSLKAFGASIALLITESFVLLLMLWFGRHFWLPNKKAES